MKKNIYLLSAGLTILSAPVSKVTGFEKGPYVHLGLEADGSRIINSGSFINPGVFNHPFKTKNNKLVMAPKILAGWYLSSHESQWVFAPELSFSYNNSKNKASYTYAAEDLQQDVTVNYKPVYGIHMRAGYKLRENTVLFGKVGFQKESYKLRYSMIDKAVVAPPPMTNSTKIKPNVVVLGVGADCQLGEEESWVLRGEVSRLIRLKAKKSPPFQVLAGGNTNSYSNFNVKSSWSALVGVGYRF